MKSLEFYKNLIINKLENVFAEIKKRNPNLYEPAIYALQGGKKLRPALLLKTVEIFGGNYENAIYPALAVEIFHNFTLVHDDIMDKSELRRNKPTVHTKWSENQAILTGDAMLILAYKFLLENSDFDIAKKIYDVFNETALQVCEGQQMDMDFEKTFDISKDDYLKMIKLKTAVLISAVFEIGAIISRTSAKNIENIKSYALNLGLAFQVRDDWLDLYGNQDVFGKKIGNDILTNKKTILLITALELADKETAGKLKFLFTVNSINQQEKIKKVSKIYENLEIKEKVQDLIKKYYETALIYADKLENMNEKGKNFLKDFAAYLVKREF